jgi:hypothetical protein
MAKKLAARHLYTFLRLMSAEGSKILKEYTGTNELLIFS